MGMLDGLLHIHGKGWKTLTVLNDTNSSLSFEKIEPSSTLITGEWNTAVGALALQETLRKKSDYEFWYTISVSSTKTISQESTYLHLMLPQAKYAGKHINIDGKEVILPLKYEKRILSNSTKAKEIAIPTAAGKVIIKGNLEFALVDSRKYNINAYSLRLILKKEKESKPDVLSFQCSFILDNKNFYPLDLRPLVNVGFSDETPNDEKGGWTDQGKNNDLSQFKPGVKYFDTIKYNIINPDENKGKSCLAFANPSRPYFLNEGIIDGKGVTGNALFLLHAIAWPCGSGKKVGDIIIKYKDNSRDVITVMENKDVANWWSPLMQPNGFVCWTDRNATVETGLYHSCFKIQNKPIAQVIIKSMNNSVWLIPAITIGPLVNIGEFHSEYTIRTSPDWKPVSLPEKIISNSVMDLSPLLPKGEANRRITIKNSHFIYEDTGERVRFKGTNLCQTACFPDKKSSEMLALNINQMGNNSVRIHHFDRDLIDFKQPEMVIDKARMDKLDYLIYCMKRRGVYISMDLYSSRRFSGKMQLKLGMTSAPSLQEYKVMMVTQPDVLDDWKEFTKLILNHVNPYTGLAWKDEPAIFSICLTNENSIGAHLKYAARPEIVKAFNEKLNDWCHANSYNPKSHSDFNRYVNYAQQDIYLKCAKFVRDLGSRALFTDMNHRSYPIQAFARNNYDYVDNHIYWDHPHFPLNNWAMPVSLKNESATRNLAECPRNATSSRIFNKPYMITEYNYCAPNEFRSESGILMGAYSSLQDWDGLYSFDYSGSDVQLTREKYFYLRIFDIISDPIRLLSERIISILFLRGDVAPAFNGIAFVATQECYDEQNPYDLSKLAMDTEFTKYGLITRLGTIVADGQKTVIPKGTTLFVGIPEKRPDCLPSDVPYTSLSQITDNKTIAKHFRSNIKNGVFSSETGEIELNQHKKGLRLVTSRSEGFILYDKDHNKGHSVQVRNLSGFCSIFVASYDDKPISDSKRLLVYHLTDVQNSMSVFESDKRKTWLKQGGLPLLLRRGSVELTVSSNMSEHARVWAVELSGRRAKEMPVIRSPGKVSFRADTFQEEGTFLVYEIAEK
ncbi:MAG: hypothetical protein JXR78_14765 [Victivallales bacterium]|nr:hypothetical protein [Victivallales bacterium]